MTFNNRLSFSGSDTKSMVEWCQWLLQPWVRYLATIVLGLLLIVHVLPPRLSSSSSSDDGAGGGGGGGMITAQTLHSPPDDRTAGGWIRAIQDDHAYGSAPEASTPFPQERFRANRGGGPEAPVIQAQGAISDPEYPKQLAPERVRLPSAAQTPITASQSYHPRNLWNANVPRVNPPKEVTTCEQSVRKARMREKCEAYRAQGAPTAVLSKLDEIRTYRFMLVDEKHKTLYCEVPKAACTSWKTFMANITGRVKPTDQSRLFQLVHDTTYHPQIGFRYLDTYSPSERKYILRTYFKFLIVRNPFTRFLSAYENKFKGEMYQTTWYHEHLGKYVLKWYRNHGKAMKNQQGNEVTFNELAAFLSNPGEHHPQRYDAHFWKIQSSCFPCLVDYDYVGKVETMAHDAEEIIKRMVPNTDIHLPFLNKNHNAVHERDSVRKAYQDMPEKILTALSEVYAEDMQVFGYEFGGNRNINCNSAKTGQPQCC